MLDFNIFSYDEISPKDMPTEHMKTIAENMGVKDTIRFIDSFGGRLLAVPSKQLTETYTEIYDVMGKDFADYILTIFSGESFNVPIRRSILKFVLPQLSLNNEIISYLIHSYGVSRSTIYRYKQAA